TDRAVVHPDLVAHLAAEQLVHRYSGRFAGDIPECHLDRADSAAPRLEAAAITDPEQRSLDIRWILAEDHWAVVQNVRLQKGLVGLDLAVARDALVSRDPNDRVRADDCALEIR